MTTTLAPIVALFELIFLVFWLRRLCRRNQKTRKIASAKSGKLLLKINTKNNLTKLSGCFYIEPD
jgi:hypothetical protein